jgi:putative peptidoglycan lipid II flippase
MSQVRSTFLLFLTQIALKGSSFIKQLLLAYFLGVSRDLDILLVAQIVPSIIGSIFSGGGGEIMAIQLRGDSTRNIHTLSLLTFILVVITLLCNGIYIAFIPFFGDVLDVEISKMQLFFTLSILVSLSKLPLSVVSSLQQFIYVRNKYKTAMYISIFAEICGLLFIVTTAAEFGIISFAIAMLLSAFINALGYIFLIKVNLLLSFNVRLWKTYKVIITQTLSKIMTLGVQTLINHTSTFAERALGFKYLSDGYVGAMSYAKSVTELPRVVMLSSILTTTYAEQVRLKNSDLPGYRFYTNKMHDFIFSLSTIAQFFSLIFAPYIIILFFQRGALTKNDLELIQVIFQVLTFGFVPGMMFGFLSKVMFIEGENTWMLKMTIVKTLVELAFMYILVLNIDHGIPVALGIGKIFFTVAILIYLSFKHPGIINHKRFFWIYSFTLIIGVLIFWTNEFVMKNMLESRSAMFHILYIGLMCFFALLAGQYLWKVHPEFRGIFKMPKYFNRIKGNRYDRVQ